MVGLGLVKLLHSNCVGTKSVGIESVGIVQCTPIFGEVMAKNKEVPSLRNTMYIIIMCTVAVSPSHC